MKEMITIKKRSSIPSNRSISFLFGFCFIVLSSSGLTWACATLKQKFSKKETQAISLYHEEIIKNQTEAMERSERALISHFGESVTLMLKDGFRFHQDSGLIGNSALLHYQSQSSVTEKQKDSINTSYRSEISNQRDAQLKTTAIEKQKTKPVSNWWLLLLLLPLIWFIGNISLLFFPQKK